MTEYFLYFILGMSITHFLGDFVFQSNWMAQNKSKNPEALMLHVLAYLAALAVGMLVCVIFFTTMTPEEAFFYFIGFLIVNGLLHFLIDDTTSRVTATLYEAKDIHNFFVVVGFDQFLHQLCLFTTSYLFFFGG